jgi:hypothetical protein
MSGVLAGGFSSAHAIGAFLQWQDAGDMDSGFGFGLKKKFQIIPIVAVEARASWLHYDQSGRYPDLDMFPLEAVGRAKLAFFYGGLGVGYFINTGDDSPKNSLGWSIVVGGEFTLFGLGAFAEGRYLFLEPDEKDSIGGSRDMGGLGANVGVILPFF